MKKALFSICLAVMGLFSLFVPSFQAYADESYSVTYYSVADVVINSISVAENSTISVPEETAQDGYMTLWYTSSERTEIYNFNTPVTSNLNLYASVIEAKTVTFMKRASNYTTGDTASEYESYDLVRVVTNSYLNFVEAETLTGYTFSHWSTTPNGTEAFDNYNTKIVENITLYPVYDNEIVSVSFYSDGLLAKRDSVEYNGIATPPTVSKQYCRFLGWKILGDDDANLINFTIYKITQNTNFEAVYEVVSATFSVSSSVYFTLLESTPSVVDCGSTVVVKIKLSDSYSNHILEQDDLYITGDYSSVSIDAGENAGEYNIAISGISSDMVFSLNSLPLNNYQVTLPTVEGINYTILTPEGSYTLEEGVYTLKVTAKFSFRVNVENGYFAKTLAFSGCNASSGVYSLIYNMSINIQSNCQVVKYHTLTLNNVDNINLTFESEYLEYTPATNIYKYEENTVATFVATAQEGYYIKSVSNATQNAGKYTIRLNEDKVVAFDTVEYVTIIIPRLDGVENVIATNILEKVDTSYKVEKGQSVVVTYSLSDTYNLSSITVSGEGLDITNGQGTFTINNVSTSATLNFNGLVKNIYAVTIVSNDMAMLSGSSSVAHGENITIAYTLEEAYNQSSLTIDNLVIDGTYSSLNIAESNITISMVTSTLSIRVTGLSLNTYSVSILSNEYGTLKTDALTFSYGDDVDFEPEFTEQYDRMSLNNSNINIVGEYDSIAIISNIVTIYDVCSNITISLKDLSINRYYVKVPAVIAGQFTLSTSSAFVEYDSSFTFTLTLGAGYTQNVNNVKVYANKSLVTPERVEGYSFTYKAENIKDDITYTLDELSINTYNVDFIDTSVEPNPTISVNIVNHGDTIDIISGNKDGYDFEGWYIDKDFSQIFNFNNAIIQNTNIYGKYTIKMYDITFVADGKIIDVITANYGDHSVDIAPQIPTKVGYDKTPAYWDFADAGIVDIVDKVATVNAIYTINTYTVRFVNQFGQVLKTETVEYNTDATAPIDVELVGYTFDKWDNVYNNVTSDMTITALYTIKTYTITFVNGNSGTKQVVYTKETVYNETVARPDDSKIVGAGYAIYGWYIDEAMTEEYNFNDRISGNRTLYGDIGVKKLIIRFVADGKVISEEIISYGSNFTNVLPNIPDKVGYNTLGWSQTSLENITSDLDVVAEYEIKKFAVTFEYEDGTKDEVVVSYGTTISELPSKGQGFGKKVVADMSLLKNIDSDRTVKVTIKDYNILIFVSCGVLAVGLIVLVIVLSVRVKVNGAIIKENKNESSKEEN